jgi:ABC-type antimicrobial peptide transport system permease subunit
MHGKIPHPASLDGQGEKRGQTGRSAARTLDLLLLKAVSQGPLHGYGVLLRIQQISGEQLKVQQGSLYLALYRVKNQAWITSEWGESENNLARRPCRCRQPRDGAAIHATINQERLFAALTGAFGVLAVTLACIGIYGIMACDVARRTNEIGVRMALGARAGMVPRMILRESLWMAAVGIALGVAGAFGLTRFVATMLYGLKAMDAETMIGAGVVLFVVAIAAGYGPARRASRIDPIVALRHEWVSTWIGKQILRFARNDK